MGCAPRMVCTRARGAVYGGFTLYRAMYINENCIVYTFKLIRGPVKITITNTIFRALPHTHPILTPQSSSGTISTYFNNR